VKYKLLFFSSLFISMAFTFIRHPQSKSTDIFVEWSTTLGRSKYYFQIVPLAIVQNLNCEGAILVGELIEGVRSEDVSFNVPYTDSIGITLTNQTVSSTGVFGLTATLKAGSFAKGQETLNFEISGIPSDKGIANFEMNTGRLICTVSFPVYQNSPSFYPDDLVYCAAGSTEVIEVESQCTGRVWMDRNLGASTRATSSTDPDAYGDLYQWGRAADGHQCRNSSFIKTLSSMDQVDHDHFIIIDLFPYNWRSPNNIKLWQGIYGINNPCPSGFRLPTEVEFEAEIECWTSIDAEGAFDSPLKLPLAGYRSGSFGLVEGVGQLGRYWTSTIRGVTSRRLALGKTSAGMLNSGRAGGSSVRCIKD
jgi:uncharacterized protein (TIGR02145 family)